MKTHNIFYKAIFIIIILLFFTCCDWEPETPPDGQSSTDIQIIDSDHSKYVDQEAICKVKWTNYNGTVYYKVTKSRNDPSSSVFNRTCNAEGNGIYTFKIPANTLQPDDYYHYVSIPDQTTNASLHILPRELNPGDYNIKVWSGLDQKLNPGEQINLLNNHFYFGYGIAVQVFDSYNVPQNDVYVKFKVVEEDEAFLYINQSNEEDIVKTKTYSEELNERTITIEGLAMVQVKYTGSEIGRTFHIRAEVSDEDYIEIPIKIYKDKEASNISDDILENGHHELFSSSEILGDGKDDDSEGPPTNTEKHIDIELDYYNGFNRNLDEIINEVIRIWEDYGVFLYFSGSAISADEIPATLSRDDAEFLLSETRDMNSGIHIVIVNSNTGDGLPEGVLLGVNIQYYSDPPDGKGFGYYECAQLASGTPESNTRQYYLNRTGIIIFSEVIENIIQNSGLNTTWDPREMKVYAWTIAHELGHALGHYCHKINTLMEGWSDNDLYGVKTTLDQENLNLINTRNKLGVETIDIRN